MSRSSSGASRQSLQPLRVQDSSRPGLTTPQNKDRHGFSKLSLTKPSSSKSETKSGLFGQRRSSGTARNSQYGAFGGTEKIKEPRPLHDKSFVQQCIRQLCEFLSENGYSNSISVKSLQAPSSKEFVKIFSFIYNCLSVGYETPVSKFEEEIPRIFRDLGYPFPLSKSSMYTVGAQHTWPQIVAALVWLTECVKLYFHQKETQLVDEFWGEETEDGIEHNKLFLEYTVKCYSSFMEGCDSFDEFDNELHPKLKALYKVNDSQLDSLQEKNKRLHEELERLEKEKENEPDRVAAMKKQKATLEKDEQTYMTYLTQYEVTVSTVTQKTDDLSEELKATEIQFEAISAERAQLKKIIDNQKYSVADIERIKYEQNELKQTINKHSKELDDDRKQLWNEELRYAKIRELIEAQLLEYHKLGRKLKLIPSATENACLHDFQIVFNPDSDRTCLAHYRNILTAPMMELLNQMAEEITIASNRKISLEDMLEQVNTMVTEKRQDVELLTDEVQKLDEMYQQKMEESEEEEKKLISEIESFKKHKQILDSGISKGFEEVQQTLQEVQQQHQLAEQQTVETGRQLFNTLNRATEAITDHLAGIEKHVEDQLAKVAKDYDESQKEDLLSGMSEVVEKYRELMTQIPHL